LARLGHLIVRLAAIILGLWIAFLGAALFLGFGLWSEWLAHNPAILSEPDQDRLAILVLGLLATPFLGAAAFAPALALIAMAEIARLRGLVSNLLLGALAALAAAWVAGAPALVPPVSGAALTVLASAGFVGGLFYWLVAGRNAGRWLE